MIQIDCHNHSCFSNDGDTSVEVMVQSAYEKGVKYFAVTDHCDINGYEKYSLATELPLAIREISSLKHQYEEKGMRLLAGIELGQPLYDMENSKKMAALEGIDVVIGSVHQLVNEQDFYYMDFAKLSAEKINELLERYYIELFETAKTDLYDTMAHITYPYRYMRERAMEVSYKRFDDIVADTYKYLIQAGKAIELNTSNSFVINEFDRNLIIYYLKLYRSLGGESITIGSDAHTPERICGGYDLAEMILSDIGFKYLTVYENRKAIKVKL